ncbi:syndetin isoform X2 [Scaptodrosophila lebanonensis]|uniref:Syndetin isoform X2 n=1 Tax=Drosophila lebanonensis TaxID=7225 RepID=A0A6J2TND6_DROLE|nr:syndetin isoform X2 [Scaptodrosophila lebanonensis]
MQNSKAKMDEFKTKFMDLLHKQTNRQMKIPAMGFSDYFIQTVTADTLSATAVAATATAPSTVINDSDDPTAGDPGSAHAQKSDQEILESIEPCYYMSDRNPQLYELKVLSAGVDYELIERTISQLRTQQKVLNKQVLQNILEQRNACSNEFVAINDTQKKLEESLWTCQKARSYLNYARTNLTTTSLEILASYRKREVLKDVLDTLCAIKKLHTTDVEVQKLLVEHNYSGAIALLLQCKSSAEEFLEYTCVQSLHKKLQETMMLMEFQLDTVLNEMVLNFDMRKYAKLQESYKLLNKSLIAMDQLHINYISAIHSSVNAVLRGYNDPHADEHVKLLYEQMCCQLTADKSIPCLISLCKTFWTILASYYQVVMWHNNYKLYPSEAESPDLYIQEKLKKGQSRIWNDILTKVCIFLQSAHLMTLKYDQFIQVLSIVQRLKKVGIEFCGEQSEKLIETMQQESEEFFRRYHISCVEEICLFLDNESWTAVDSFAHILQLPEFRSVRHTLRRHKSPPVALLASSSSANNSPISNNNCDELVSVHSQEGGSSIYGSYGYFLRFSEKSSPFDGGLDPAMLEEDILSGIVDEASCYFSEESDEEQKSLQSKEFDDSSQLLVNNTALNVLRCIGRYLQMCKLLHCISPKIIASMLELLDFYAYAVHDIFAKDAIVPIGSLYTPRLEQRFRAVEKNVLKQIKMWPLNFSSLANNELANPDTLYGLQQRIVAVEAGQSMLQQFQTLKHYLNHLLPTNERPMLASYLEYEDFMADVAKPVYICVTSHIIDLSAVLAQMAKVKWDVNHVIHQHSSYSDVMNRNIQNFAMRLEEIAKEVPIPNTHVWNSMAHVATHLLVEGFSNVKKCSAGGRALMQLDFANFMSFLELISNQKFPQYGAYVDVFVKTYYFSAEQFEQWIKEQRHGELYSVKQLTNLINCICGSDKRTKQKLLQLLDDCNNAMQHGPTSAHNTGSSTSNLSNVI